MSRRRTVDAATTPPAAEGSLAWLRSRRDRDGQPMLDETGFAAGERLRRDFGLASLGGRLTTDWDAFGSARGHTGAGGMTPSEAAGAARQRIERALAAVGPELAGPLVDVCCHERTLPEVERLRGWPLRSGKVVLRLALAALARHYGLSRAAVGPAARGSRHWGAADYRPRA